MIDQILEDDESQPRKQRHTAKRIYDRLREEHSFTGGYTIVKDYVRRARLRHQEVFVPLAHTPGHAQADFGEALVVIAGQEQKAHFLCVDLPHSDDAFVMAFPAENTESFCEPPRVCRRLQPMRRWSDDESRKERSEAICAGGAGARGADGDGPCGGVSFAVGRGAFRGS